MSETRYWGSYMTDFIKLYPEVDSAKVKTYLKQSPEVIDKSVAIFEEEKVGCFPPHGAFYIMVDISCCGMDSEEFALKLLAEEHVSVAPGGTFGETSKQMIRISYGTDMEPLCEGIRRLCRFIRKYTK